MSLAFAGDLEGDGPADALFEKYVTATQANVLNGIQMDAEVEASLPKLKKFGTLSALRTITKVGKVTWDKLRWSGDNTIKKDVIARYIQAEQETISDPSKLAINQKNYKFKYKGLEDKDGKRVHVFQLQPRKKAVGLFKGELWVDPDTALPLREAGQFVKNPSIFLKKVEFVREYELVNGQAIPKHVESKINTRVWGSAEVSINYRNFAKAEETPTVPSN
ncbi:hypothetical protein F183_A53010 [Bryobacterales bacterium F-183]|nr:hypothetical protein F183_A53010 [Bryobacterales bacterium F-183]